MCSSDLTRPIVAAGFEPSYDNLTTQPSLEQPARYAKETFISKHDSYPSQRSEVDLVDSRYPREQLRVGKSSRATVDAPKKFKRDMGYYDEDGQYHSLRHGLHKVADRVRHPIHGHRHQHSSSHSSVSSSHSEPREEVVVKEQYSASSAPAPSRAPAPARRHSTSVISAAPAPAPRVKYAAPRKMAPPNTITIPCHHIRIGDLLILQGRPCQVIRITTSSQTGQHRYLGVDLFTKQLHEESSFISNPGPSVVVQNMLGPVFKQYRVLDIREDGRVVAMTEGGDRKSTRLNSSHWE